MARVFILTLAAVGLLTVPAAAQNLDDLPRGHTFPKDGYFPDPGKVVYVIFWHHKQRVSEFDFRDFFMNADGVNDTTARKIKEAMEKQYPNLTVYMKETNEKDVKALVERETARVKSIDVAWVDAEQPAKIKMPKMKIADNAVRLTYDDDAPKGGSDGARIPKRSAKEDREALDRDGARYNRDLTTFLRDLDACEDDTAALNRALRAFNALPADQQTREEVDRLREWKKKSTEWQRDLIMQKKDLDKRKKDLEARGAVFGAR
jgi:hypothetical protein